MDQVGLTSARWMLPGGHGCKLCAYSSTQSRPSGGRFPLPFIETSRSSSQAPRQQAQTPSLRLGRHLLGPRRAGMPARQRAGRGLACRVTPSSSSAALHQVGTLCGKTAAGQFSPSIPSLLHPKDRCLPQCCTAPLGGTVVVCGSSKSSAGAQERHGLGCFGVLWAAAPFTALPAACRRRGLVFILYPRKQQEKPFAACRSPVVYSQTSPASHPARRAGY